MSSDSSSEGATTAPHVEKVEGDPRLQPETADIPERYLQLLELSTRADYDSFHMGCPIYLAGMPPFIFILIVILSDILITLITYYFVIF